MSRLPTYFLSHGGGPWPWMKAQTGTTFNKLEVSLQAIARDIGAQINAVLIISGHWEENAFTLSSSPHPSMIYDYSGFPEHTYHIQYPAPGSPELAHRVLTMLKAAGVPAALDPYRGFDHGTFSVMGATFPAADVPIVQMSLKSNLDPRAHLEVGRLLAPLRDEGVLIIGSGLSYHNLRSFGPSAKAPSRAFDLWLQRILVASSPQERNHQLVHWEAAPSARLAHPREDHLLPLMVVAGAAQDDPGHCVYHEDDFFGAICVSSFRFGGLPASERDNPKTLPARSSNSL